MNYIVVLFPILIGLVITLTSLDKFGLPTSTLPYLIINLPLWVISFGLYVTVFTEHSFGWFFFVILGIVIVASLTTH